jgi:transposase
MSERFEIPLDIPDVRIIKTETNARGDFIISVESTMEGTECHRCGSRITKPYGHDREITLRHLSILGTHTYIRIRPKRYLCQDCDDRPTTTQKTSWYETRSEQTKAYEKHILLALVNSTVKDVSRKEGIGYEAVMGIVDRYLDGQANWDEFERLEVIGVDEIALKKGHRDFVTIITAYSDEEGNIQLLAVLKDRGKDTVKAFFYSIPKRLRKTVRVVCTDLYDGFMNAAREVFGKRVRIVADRFHVAKLYRKGLDTLRKQEMKRLKRELPEKSYQELKGVMWLLRKDENSLTEEEWKVLTQLFSYSPMLALAYIFCRALTEIFDRNLSVSEAKLTLAAWKQLVAESKLECFDGFLSTMEEHMDEIANYFAGRHNSGFVEGLNNKIKVIKRRCYGILNIEHLFQRIHLDLAGYSLFS